MELIRYNLRLFLMSTLIGIIILIVLSINNVSGITLYVDDNAPEGGDGSIEKPFKTIQDGINNSVNGDTLRVWEGVYYENVVVNKSLDVIGNRSTNTIIDGGDVVWIVEITADHVNFSGFKLINGNVGITINANNSNIHHNNCSDIINGITINNNNNTVFFNICVNNQNYGIMVDDQDNYVHHNTCSNSKDFGIFIWGGSNSTIANNIVTSNTNVGIMNGLRSNDNNISNNEISHNQIGIDIFYYSNNNEIIGNTITENDIGILVDYWSIDNNAFSNNIYNNAEFGINASLNNGTQIDARLNWWGNDSGPYHPDANPTGKGDNITDDVDFNPWRDEEIYDNDGSHSAVLSGLVVGQDDKPLGGVLIEVTGDGYSYKGITNKSGIYRIINIPLLFGIWDISISKEGYRQAHIQSQITQDTIINFTLTPINILYVDDDAAMGGDGSFEFPFNTIQGAINHAQKGDVIRVWDGIYHEEVVINKTVNLIGNGSMTTIIDGDNATWIVEITSDYVDMSGFGIRNGSEGIVVYANYSYIYENNCSNLNHGIHVYKYNNTISHNTCSNNEVTGIFLDQSGNHVHHNTCSLSRYGIYVRGSSNNTIADNICISNQEHGIWIAIRSNDNVIVNNMIRDNLIGIYLYYFSNNNYISNSTITENGIGILLAISSKNNIAKGNIIMGNHQYGINATFNNESEIDARNNYWGDDSGPFNGELNPSGNGDSITYNVQFDPWTGKGKIDKSNDLLPYFPILFVVGNVIILSFIFHSSSNLRFKASSLFLSLYTRLNEKTIEKDLFQQNVRGRIFQYIKDNPSINFSMIKNEIQSGTGNTMYHLSVLQRKGYIRFACKGNLKCYWVKDQFPGIDKASRLEIQENILQIISQHGRISRTELLTLLKISKSTLHKHLQRLEKKGLIILVKEGRNHFCSLTNQ